MTVARLASDPNPPNPTQRISYTAASPSLGANLNREGLAERVADVLIYDNGAAPNCFQTGNAISLVYSMPLASAAGLDQFDSAGVAGLVALIATGPSAAAITVLQQGTAGNLTSGETGAAVRVRNVRANASGLGAGVNVTATVSAAMPGTMAATVLNVGTAWSTIRSGAGITTQGAGAQNADATLSKHAVLSFSEGFDGAMRAAGANVSGVWGDMATGATSLVLDAGNTVPLGVSVTFPAQIVGGGLKFALRSGGSCSGPAQCYAVYDTTQSSSTAGTVTMTTQAAARSGADGSTPAVGVHVGPISATGTVTLRALFGPGIAGSGNDDVNVSAVPRYAGTRLMFSGDWFTVTPSVVMAALSSTSVNFPPTWVGAKATSTVILTNTGALPLQIGGTQISSGDFSQHNDCGSVLAGMASCLITVEFAPLTAGMQVGILTIQSNASTALAVQLTGTGEVVNPVPVVTSLSPGGTQAGLSYQRLVVKGAKFVNGAAVLWNGTPRATTFVSDKELNATLVTSDLATAGTAQVAVSNPAPGGGISNALNFTVGAGALPASPYLYYLPHVVSGGGFCTKITVVDMSGQANAVTVNFVGQDGSLLESRSQALAAGGTLRLQTDDPFGDASTRWAIVGTTGKATAHVMFEYRSAEGVEQVSNTVGFGDSPPMAEFTMPVEFAPRPEGAMAGRTVGLALANPNGITVMAAVQIMDAAGTILVTYNVPLPPFGQTAVDLATVPEIRKALPAGTFVGSLAATAGAPVSVIALEDNYGPFAALAPASGRAKY